MNAIQFFQEHGIEKARKVVEGAPDGAELFHTNTYLKNVHSDGKTDHFARWSDGFNDWINASADRNFINECVDLSDLKRLVESVDLVKRYGGIAEVKTLHQDEFWCERAFERLKQAIADYELINEVK